MSKIKCFIACAFGKDDVDSLYDDAILEALSQIDIKAFRVDKINHNQKIDEKIIDLINNSDFGISDLTYARPSVYFESGLLEGQGKPVIYLARKDHFSSSKEDILGNYKIHFDLITKNIIPWDKIDSKLIKEIKQRILLVTEPMLRRQNEEFERSEAKKTFNLLSIDDRKSTLKKYILDFIKKNFRNAKILSNLTNVISIITPFNSINHKVLFLISASFTKKHLISYSPVGNAWIYFRDFLEADSSTEIIVVIISLNSLRTATIDTALSSCKKISEKLYEQKLLSFTFKYLFIDNIDSEIIFMEKLNKSFQGFRLT
jgi:nucleoside 2-deoxyribosyltransferase